MKTRRLSAFSLVELLMALGSFATVTVVLLSFTSTSARLISRNLATNHGHETIRTSSQRLLADMHSAASAFRLMSFNGSTFSDVTPTATTDRDPLNPAETQFISTRANTVRFWRSAGGPFRLTSDTTPATRTMTFDFGTSTYRPQIGDKVRFPLLNREFDIQAVPSTNSITISDAAGIGFTISTAGTNVTTGYFYRRAAYSVWSQQLRYHPNFFGSSMNTRTLIRDNVTSPQPFALLFQNGSLTDDSLSLRVSLESYDGNYSARMFLNGATTLQTIVSARNHPALITTAN